MPYLVYLIAPGFLENSQKFNIAVEFTRITFPFLIFVSLSSFFSGILNSNNRFAAALEIKSAVLPMNHRGNEPCHGQCVVAILGHQYKEI